MWAAQRQPTVQTLTASNGSTFSDSPGLGILGLCFLSISLPSRLVFLCVIKLEYSILLTQCHPSLSHVATHRRTSYPPDELCY